MFGKKTEPIFSRKLTLKGKTPKIQLLNDPRAAGQQKHPPKDPTGPPPGLNIDLNTKAPQKNVFSAPVRPNITTKAVKFVPKVKSSGCAYHLQAQPNCIYCANPNPTAQPNPNPTPQPNPNPNPTPQPNPNPTPKPYPNPPSKQKPKLNPQPTPNPTPQPKHNPQPKTNTKLHPPPQPKPPPYITPKPKPTSQFIPKPQPDFCPPPKLPNPPSPKPPCSCQPSCFIANDQPGKYLYELPECVDFISLSGVGAGGGGAGGMVTDYNISGGGGGGGASMVNCPIFNVPPKTQVYVEIGQGGKGGQIGKNGKPGGITSVALIDPKTGKTIIQHKINPGQGGCVPGKQPGSSDKEHNSVPPVDNTGGSGGTSDSPTLSGTPGENGKVMPQSFQAVPGGSGAPSLVAPGGAGGVAVAANDIGLPNQTTNQSTLTNIFNGKDGQMGSGGGGGASAIGSGTGGHGGNGYIVLQLGHQLKPIAILK